jgi:hypothetical protein
MVLLLDNGVCIVVGLPDFDNKKLPGGRAVLVCRRVDLPAAGCPDACFHPHHHHAEE